jgi:hypothetical protein
VPFDELPASVRDTVQRIINHPTLSARAPAEDFVGVPALYEWLLDHPDRAAQAWHRLGSPCLDITDRGSGWFGWTDQQGSDLSWETIYRSPQLRIWYADGKARAGALVPALSVRAVVILHHGSYQDPAGKSRICQQADLYFQTDSRTASLVTRLMGPAAPRLAEQCVTQMQIFFSALTRYLDRHPERADALFFGDRPLGRVTPAQTDKSMARGEQ